MRSGLQGYRKVTKIGAAEKEGQSCVHLYPTTSGSKLKKLMQKKEEAMKIRERKNWPIKIIEN